MPFTSEIMVIDPGLHTPELDSFNLISNISPFPVSYHLPAICGLETMEKHERRTLLKGIIILGSSASVHDDLAWQNQLRSWIETHLKKSIPTLAICYGHQLISQIFGAKIEELEKKQKGLRRLLITQSSPLGLENTSGEVVVSHKELVTSLPENMKAISSAPEKLFQYDALMHTHLPIWSFQAHIEATPLFCSNQQLFLPKNQTLQFGHQLLKNFMLNISDN